MGEATHLGSFIRECRRGLKYTSRQVARLSSGRRDIPSISNSYLISVENGKHIPRLDKVIALAEVLNVPVTQLVDRCREDIVTPGDAPAGIDFHALLEAGRERAEMNEHGTALELYRQAAQAAVAANGSVAAEDKGELRLRMATSYRQLKINRVAKEELENVLKERGLSATLRARAAHGLSEIYREEGNTFLGAVVAREALQMAQAAGDEVLEGKLLSSLGSVAAEEGRLDDALALYRDSAAKLRRTGHERLATIARIQQGLILVEKRDHFRAIDLLRGELAELREQDPYSRGWLHVGLAKAYYGAENYKSARAHARSAKEAAEKIDAPDLVFLALYYTWQVARREHAEEMAAVYFERLKYYRNKLEVGLQEIEAFDRAQRQAASRATSEKGVA